MRKVELYDTTLRDGTQRAGVSLSVDDKLRVMQALDRLGVDYIEGGWPGSNPKDAQFFARARKVRLETATLTAFGMTRRPDSKCDDDQNLAALIDARTPVVCLVGKSSVRQVTQTIRTSLHENLSMVSETILWMRDRGVRVFFDAEHFFDGAALDQGYALRVLEAALSAGAERVILCDTNGGSLPDRVHELASWVVMELGPLVGGHFHDDCGCAVANSLAAVAAGAVHIQGCINGYGERCGNADIVTIAGNLEMKKGIQALPSGRIESLTETSRFVAEVFNIAPDAHQPFVGQVAFAHKGGLHISAVVRDPSAYEHVSPKAVGNERKLLASDLSGAATLRAKAESVGLELDGSQLREALERLKQLEYDGASFEAADGSIQLLLMEVSGWQQDYFDPLGFRAIVEEAGLGEPSAEATVRIRVAGNRRVAAAEGKGPVDALNHALRAALTDRYPEISEFHLIDYKVRVIDPSAATAARVRVLVETSDGHSSWNTVGVSENIIEASYRALLDAVVLGLWHAEQRRDPIQGRAAV